MTKAELDACIQRVHELNADLNNLYLQRKQVNLDINKREEERARLVRAISEGISILVRQGIGDSDG